jgi:hypothetical protein
MSIDPKIAFWFGVWTWLLLGIANGSGHLPTSFSKQVADQIISWAAFLGWMNTGILTAASGYSANRAGPLAGVPAAAVKPIIIIAIAVWSLFALGGTAHAVTMPKPRPAAAQVDPLQKIMDDVASKSTTIVASVIEAIQEADDDAATLTNPSDLTSYRDPIAHACYPAQIKFLQSLPQIQAIKAPKPYNVIVLFQRKRDLVAQIKAGLPAYLKVGCAALLKDEETIFIQTLGLIGVPVAAGALTGVFPPAAPITLPALTLPGV